MFKSKNSCVAVGFVIDEQMEREIDICYKEHEDAEWYAYRSYYKKWDWSRCDAESLSGPEWDEHEEYLHELEAELQPDEEEERALFEWRLGLPEDLPDIDETVFAVAHQRAKGRTREQRQSKRRYKAYERNGVLTHLHFRHVQRVCDNRHLHKFGCYHELYCHHSWRDTISTSYRNEGKVEIRAALQEQNAA